MFGAVLCLLPSLSFCSAIPARGLKPKVKRSEAGPNLPTDFPDPCIINTNGTWYAFATTSDHVNIPVATVPWNDFEGQWQLLLDATGKPIDALPSVPTWVNMTG